MTLISGKPSSQAKVMLDTLQGAVAKSLERKKRLGQYAVIWQNGRPVQAGDDAPKNAQK